MSLPITGPPARGAGMTKSPVTGLRRLSRLIATSEMQARVGRTRALRLGNRRQDRRVQRGERRQDVLLRARALNQLERLRQDRDAARGRHEPGLGLRALVAAEEEDLVLAQRAADREAALVAARLRLGDAVLLIEEVVRVQLLVLEVEMRRPLEDVGAAAGDELEVAAARPAGRGVVEAGLQLDFLERVGRRRHVVVQRPFVARQVRRVDAVEEQARAGGARAVDRRRDVAGAVDEHGRQIGADARFGRQQVREAAGRRRNDFELGAAQTARGRRRR